MTAVLDYAMIPPEVTSARMYAGPGSAPMLAAASAWNGLAAELRSTAMVYDAVLTGLTGDEWHGPASASMAAAATPYVVWMSGTAAQAEQTAVQAEAAAGAFEAAYAATVPPPVIAANRAQLMTLIATNFLGQNTPAIAATEALYTEMWAQDAAAMYGYAGSSAVASQLTAFTQPNQVANEGGLAAQSTAVAQASGTAAGTQQSTLSQLMSQIPTTLQGLSSSTGSASPLGLSDILGSGTTTSGNGLLDILGPNSNFWNTIASTGLGMAPFTMLSPLMSLSGAGGAAGAAEAAVEGAVAGTVSGPVGSIGGLGAIGGPVSAGLGKAASIGTLSAPPSWTAAAPLPSPLASTLGGTPMIAPQGEAGMPGMPLGGGLGAQGSGRATPQYGFRPTFVARPPAAG